MIPTAEIRKILDLSLHWSTETRVQKDFEKSLSLYLYKPQPTAGSSTSFVHQPNVMSLILLILILASDRLWLLLFFDVR